MSPRAAWRLERLGFFAVFDYVLGKNGWTADGHTLEGEVDPEIFASLHLREAETCDQDAPVRELRDRASDGRIVVLNEHSVVVGELWPRDLREAAEDATAERAMRPGPTTIRGGELIPEIAPRMQRANASRVIVTDAGGQLLGELHRDDAERALDRLRERHARHHEHGA